MAAPRIKTTVVGSYPFPDWLGALPSEQAVIDATRVVIHTQEQAGIASIPERTPKRESKRGVTPIWTTSPKTPTAP